MKDEKSIFCKLAGGEIPAATLYEDAQFRVILDASPATRGHALVLPKQHARDIFELEDDVLRDLIVVGQKVAAAMKEVLGCDGVNLVQNNGICAGQTVFHFHLHVIPRYDGDGQRIGWTPGEADPGTQEELVRVLSAALRD